jgi:hypothetical protein
LLPFEFGIAAQQQYNQQIAQRVAQQNAARAQPQPQQTQQPASAPFADFGIPALPPIPFNKQYVIPQSLLNGSAPQSASPITAPQGNPGGGMPALTMQQRFEHNLAANAQGLLKSNKVRLDSEQTQYTQDHDPKSSRWQHLWQAAAQKREFKQQQSNLQQQRDLLAEQINDLSLTPDLNSGSMSATAADIQNSPKYKKQLALSEQKRHLEERIAFSKQNQVSLEYAYPALAAVEGETGKDPQDIQRVQSRIPDKFDGIRSNIDKLNGEVAKDPSVAVLFDSVVAAQLQDKSITAPRRQQLTEWLNSKREEKAQNAQWGMLASGGLFVASFVPALQEVAIPLRVIGAGLGGVTMASEIPDLMLLDAAAQAGLGGNRLTSQSPEQAKFNLVMGYANVGLAGLDVGLEVGAVQKLAGLTGKLASAGVQVSREKWVQAMEWMKQGPAGVEKARAFLASIKGLSQEKVAEAIRIIKAGFSPQDVEIVGVPSGQSAVKTTEENVKDAKALQSRGNAGGTATAKKKLKDMTPAERFADAEGKYGQTQNWDQVKSLVGQSVNPNMQLPPGYIFYEKPANRFGQRALFILRENADDGSFVPLMIEKGKIQAGKTRLSRDAMKANLKAVGINVPKDWQINHLIPDEIAQSNPLMIEMLKRDIYDVDRASNLLPMPGDAAVRKANPNLMGHQGSHADYSSLIKDELNRPLAD